MEVWYKLTIQRVERVNGKDRIDESKPPVLLAVLNEKWQVKEVDRAVGKAQDDYWELGTPRSLTCPTRARLSGG